MGTMQPAFKYGGTLPRAYKFTGKERDSESNLDYFGARHYGSILGRFMQPDAKQFTARHIGNPQKWNRYSYVHNNPLSFIDPDGLDDFLIFRPEATSSRRWAGLAATAKQNGHTVTMYNGKNASAAAYTDALQKPGAHVIFVGHTVENSKNEAGSVVTATGDVGKFTTTGAPGSNTTYTGYTFVPGPTADSPPTMQPDPVPVPNVSVSSVAIFGCDSADLQSQYSNTTFTGVASGTDNQTSLSGLDSSAAAFAQSMVSTRSPDPTAATGAANIALQNSPDPQDQNGDTVKTEQKDRLQ